MDIIISFLVSVMASVAGYYICKWLDRNHKETPWNGAPWGFIALAWNYLFLGYYYNITIQGLCQSLYLKNHAAAS